MVEPAYRQEVKKRRPYRRDQIRDAAVENFHARGYHATSMAHIASAVGMTAGALYQHWSDKQEILDAAVQGGSEELLRRIRSLAEVDAEPASGLVAMLDEVVEFVTGQTALAAVARHDRPLASEQARARSERAERLVLVELAHVLSSVRPDLSEREVRATVHAVIGLIYSLTHAEPALDSVRTASYLRTAVRAVVTPSSEALLSEG